MIYIYIYMNVLIIANMCRDYFSEWVVDEEEDKLRRKKEYYIAHADAFNDYCVDERKVCTVKSTDVLNQRPESIDINALLNDPTLNKHFEEKMKEVKAHDEL
jgi:hypothetical protein